MGDDPNAITAFFREAAETGHKRDKGAMLLGWGSGTATSKACSGHRKLEEARTLSSGSLRREWGSCQHADFSPVGLRPDS